jgi:hypothetical protein
VENPYFPRTHFKQQWQPLQRSAIARHSPLASKLLSKNQQPWQALSIKKNFLKKQTLAGRY